MIEEFLLSKRKIIISLFLVLGILLLMFLFFGRTIFFLETQVKAQTSTSSDVTVTAIVQPWLDFEISSTTMAMSPALVQADGTINIGSTGNLGLSLGTNNVVGWQVRIQGANGGLYSPTATYTIPSVSATSTLATGTEAYGANATSTMSGANIGSYYDYYGTDTVGKIASTTDELLVSKSTANAKVSVANLQIKATASALTPPANDYSDTVTLTASTLLP